MLPMGRLLTRMTRVFTRVMFAAAICLALATVGLLCKKSRLVEASVDPTMRVAAAPAAAAPGAGPIRRSTFKTIDWDDLIPKNWDPYAGLRTEDVSKLRDSGLRARELMDKLRVAWDQAPTVPAVEGSAVKVAGYLVPLEEDHSGLSEFLLVPYFGACIHTPPPPANQIIHVFAKTPVTGFKAMDTVWVSGIIKQGRDDSDMGVSGYEISAEGVERYEAPQTGRG